MKEVFILTFSEIALKGRNKKIFINQLEANIRFRLNQIELNYDLALEQSKFLLFFSEFEKNQQQVVRIIKKIPGISWINWGFFLENKHEKITAAIQQILTIKQPSTFRISAKAYSKKSWTSSSQLIDFAANVIFKANPNIKVDLNNYDLEINIKVFSETKVFVYFNYEIAIDGLPAGSTGNAITLLSGGIDSPVAAYKMISRGLNTHFISFLTPKTSSKETVYKIKKLATHLNQFNATPKKLFIINFAPVQSQIKARGFENYRIVLLRRAFLKFTTYLLKNDPMLALEEVNSLIMGDSLGQVASQTLSSQSAQIKISEFPIFKPLIGSSKREIIDLATKIGTYNYSILKGDDMCSDFTPTNPILNPKISKIIAQEERIGDLDELFQKIIKQHMIIIDLK